MLLLTHGDATVNVQVETQIATAEQQQIAAAAGLASITLDCQAQGDALRRAHPALIAALRREDACQEAVDAAAALDAALHAALHLASGAAKVKAAAQEVTLTQQRSTVLHLYLQGMCSYRR